MTFINSLKSSRQQARLSSVAYSIHSYLGFTVIKNQKLRKADLLKSALELHGVHRISVVNEVLSTFIIKIIDGDKVPSAIGILESNTSSSLTPHPLHQYKKVFKESLQSMAGTCMDEFEEEMKSRNKNEINESQIYYSP